MLARCAASYCAYCVRPCHFCGSEARIIPGIIERGCELCPLLRKKDGQRAYVRLKARPAAAGDGSRACDFPGYRVVFASLRPGQASSELKDRISILETDEFAKQRDTIWAAMSESQRRLAEFV
jgi:hypothetical protein